MKYLAIIFAIVLCSCHEEFDPTMAQLYWENLSNTQRCVSFALENKFYDLANKYLKDVDKADSDVVNYYRKCGRSADYSGTIFILTYGKYCYEAIDYHHKSSYVLQNDSTPPTLSTKTVSGCNGLDQSYFGGSHNVSVIDTISFSLINKNK